jgi:CzcA family heavy metal efflux pump
MNLPEIAVKRPITTIMAFAALSLLGVVALSGLNLDILPDIEPTAASIVTLYPGASAKDVEAEVTKYIEDQVSTIANVDRLESKSKDNISIVNCIFNWGSDLDAAINDMREQIDLAKPNIAAGAKEPFIFKFSSSMVPILVLTIRGKELGPDLYRIVDRQLADPLKRVPGVGTILYEGGVKRQINVHFNRDILEAHHVSVNQIQNVLRGENLDLPAGSVKAGSKELQIRIEGRFRNAAEIGDIIIGRTTGALIRIKDVARVSDTHEELTQWGWANGFPGMVMIIQKQSGANSVKVIEAVKKRLDLLKSRIDADIEIHTVVDTSDYIYAMIKSLAEAAVVGAVLVVVVCFVFLRRIRSSLVVVLAMPISVISAFIGLYFMGYTLNVISLMSLAIALGLVVDDAIVVLENIIRHADGGAKLQYASIYGATEVALPVVASTLTIVAVFVPLLFIKGVAGIIFSQLAFIIIVTIMASLFVSLTITPMAASRLLYEKGRVKTSRLFTWSEEKFDEMESAYARLLSWALHHGKISIALVLLIGLACLPLFMMIGTEFLPEVDSSEIEIITELPEGTQGRVTARYIENVLEILQKEPEIEASYALAGQSKKGLQGILGFSDGTNIGKIGVRLVPKEKRKRSANAIAADLRSKIGALPGADKLSIRAISAIQKQFFGGGRAISIEVSGQDQESTERVSENVCGIVEQTPGTVDVSAGAKRFRPEIRIRPDRDRASSLGLNVAILADTLRTNYYGFNDTKLRSAGDDFDIELRLKEDERKSISQIGDTPIMSLGGAMVKLRNVAEVEETFGPVEIERKNRVRVMRIQAGVRGRVLGDVKDDISAKLVSVKLPPGVSIQWSGEVEEQAKAFHDLFFLLILGIILVYMVIAAQFESLRDPLIIMCSVPFAFVGVIFAFALTATPLSLITFIGIIMLMGIVVKNAIVLVDVTRQLKKQGMDLYDAVVSGGKIRLRPVLMTSLVNIFSMVPLALSRGVGSEVWNVMGITVIGGQLVSGLVTLVLVPLAYFLAHRRDYNGDKEECRKARGEISV